MVTLTTPAILSILKEISRETISNKSADFIKKGINYEFRSGETTYFLVSIIQLSSSPVMVTFYPKSSSYAVCLDIANKLDTFVKPTKLDITV